MLAKPRLLVPCGLKTLLGGLRQAVETTQARDIAQYAASYCTELLQYRQENPSMDFKDLVQEYQRRQENTQIQFCPSQITSESNILPTPPTKDKAESQAVESEKEQGTVKPDPDPCNTSPTKDKAESEVVESEKEQGTVKPDPDPCNTSGAEAMNTDGEKDQLQDDPCLGVEAPPEQSAYLPKRLDIVSQPTQSQPTKNLDKKASFNESVPKMSIDQEVYPTTSRQDLDGQYSLPEDVPSNGRQTDQTPGIPVKSISKPHNVENLPGNRIISNGSQHPLDQTPLSASETTTYLSTVESPATDPSPQEEAQYKVMSRDTDNLQKTPEMPSSNLYKIQISVDKPKSNMCYEPAYIPGRETSMVHIVTSIPTGITMPAMISLETSPVHYIPAPNRPPPENIETPTLQGRHPTQDPGKYESVYAPSHPYAYQRPSPSKLQQSTYVNTEGSKYNAPCGQRKFNSPETDNMRGYLDGSSQTSASDLKQAGSYWLNNPGKNDQEIPWTLHQNADLNYSLLSINSRYRTELSRSQSQEYTECLSFMKNPPSPNTQSTAPENVPSHEDKLDTSPLYASESSSNRKTERSRDEQGSLTTTPIPLGMAKPCTENRMRTLSFQIEPMTISEPTSEVKGEQMNDSPCMTYLAGTKSIPYFTAHRSARNVIPVKVTEEDALSVARLAGAQSIPSFAAHRSARNASLVEDPEEEKKMIDALSVTQLAEPKSIVSFTEHRKAIAEAAATSKSPTFMHGVDQKQSRGSKQLGIKKV